MLTKDRDLIVIQSIFNCLYYLTQIASNVLMILLLVDKVSCNLIYAMDIVF